MDRFNVYGNWQFDDVIALNTNPPIERGDVVRVLKKKDGVVQATHKGCRVWFHVDNLTRGYFRRIDKRLSNGLLLTK